MKLTTKILKNLINEELEKISEMGSYSTRSAKEINAEIKKLDVLIAVETDPDIKSELESERNELYQDLADAM